MILTKSKYFSKAFYKLFLILTLQLSLITSTYSQDNPNVLMIVLDDLNDYIEDLEGHPQALTPNINKLVSQGVLFTNAHSNAPNCNVSRASVLTGLLPNTTQFYGVESNDNWRDNTVIANSKTISEYFSENGYTTYKTGKVAHTEDTESSRWDNRLLNSLNYGPFAYNGTENVVHPNTILAYAETGGVIDGTLARLSDIPDVPFDGINPGYKGWWSNGAPFNYINDNNRDVMPDENSVAWIQNNITTLDAANSSDPFFMAVGLIRPHTPFVVPDKYFDMFPIENVKIPMIRRHDRGDTAFEEGTVGCKLFNVLDDSYTDRQKSLREKTQAYLAAVAFADDMVGQLLNTLENSSYANNTMVMLFSDHGYHIGEKQYVSENTLWDEATRIPLIISHPDYSINAGQTVDHPVSLIDIYPTLKDFCSLTGNTKKNTGGADLDGYSLKPFIENPNTTVWDGPALAITSANVETSTDPNAQDYSVRTKKYRYIKYQNGDEELYDHTLDAHEWRNLVEVPDYNPVKEGLEQALHQALQEESETGLIMLDDMVDDSKALEMLNWNFTNQTSGNLINDPEQVQRKNLNSGQLIYDATNVHTFKVDFWGLENQTSINYGIIKAYTATIDSVYTEIPLSHIESGYTGNRRLFHFTPNAPVNSNTKYLKIVLIGGDATWKGLVGAVRLYDNSSPVSTDYSYIDNIVVNADSNLFDFDDADLRGNQSGLPNFTDPLSNSNHFYRSIGDFYFTSDANASLYDNDTERLVRENNDPTDLELVYNVDNLNYYRMEFWTLKDRTLEDINTITGEIQTFISEHQDSVEDYVEVPTKFVKIKANDDLIKYAIVPVGEIDTDVNYFKITVSGGTGPMSQGQIGAIHLYENSMYSNDNSLTVDTSEEKLKSVSVYPNPVADKLYFSGFNTPHHIQVYTITGQLVMEKEVNSSMDVSNLRNGLYLVKIDNGLVLKFVKKTN